MESSGAFVGQKLSRYLILELAGAGGMGVVYRARDEKLERDVAIKILPPGSLEDSTARARFRKEALALSQLNHPSVATLFDFDTVEGTDFLVMEYIPGETLEERLRRGPIPPAQLAHMAAQMAEGLAAAHAKGVVHRDLKPANVRLMPEGRVKLLDFGLAKALVPAQGTAATEALTQPHTVMGTLAYMAPEQLLGEPATERSDLYSLGAVMYEMATGRHPFAASSAKSMSFALLQETPPPPRQLNPAIPEPLDALIQRCLSKTPEERPATAAEVAGTLLRNPGPVPLAPAAAPPPRRSGHVSNVFAILAPLAVLGGVLLANPGDFRGKLAAKMGLGSGQRIRSVAVLPLENLSGDSSQVYFADGITDELITQLAQVGSLRVISRTSAVRFRGSSKSLPDIAKELGVDAIVEGSVERAGGRVRVRAQLIEAATDEHLWAQSYERDLKDVLSLQSELAQAIVQQVRAKLTPQEAQRLARATPVDPQAHEDYLRGRYYWSRRTEDALRKGTQYFNRAIQRDPSYAAAYAGLADSWIVLANLLYVPPDQGYPRAEAAARKALELDPNLASAHASLGFAHSRYVGNWADSEREFKRAEELNPGDPVTHLWYGVALIMINRLPDAEVQMARARASDPLSLVILSVSAWPAALQGRTREALEFCRHAEELDSSFYLVRWFEGLAHNMAGHPEEAVKALRTGLDLAPDNRWLEAGLGYSLARSGQREEARRVLEHLERIARTEYVSAYGLAQIHLALGERDAALDALEAALKRHDSYQFYLQADPYFAPLKGEPRYEALLRQLRAQAS